VRVHQLPKFLVKVDHAVVALLLRDVRRVAKAIAAWGNTYLAPSGLEDEIGDAILPQAVGLGFVISPLWGWG
jgi:hypothetical protein